MYRFDVKTLLSLVGCIVFVTSCATKMPEIEKPTAHEMGDSSVVMDGCGEGPNSGYLFCRANDGVESNQFIRIHIPDANCDRDSCVSWRTLRKNGTISAVGSVNKGETSVMIPLSVLMDYKGPITKKQEGEYGVQIRVFHEDGDGLKRAVIADGIVRVWGVDKNYAPMACDDPKLGWKLKIDPKCSVHYSSGLRSKLCGDCGKKGVPDDGLFTE